MNNNFAVIDDRIIPRRLHTELGEEKLCTHCGEYWPLTNEFWYFQKSTSKSGVTLRAVGACKGCYIQKYKPERLLTKKLAIKSSYQLAKQGELAA